MAESYDKEWQLATLRESVASWNQWRIVHPETKIDLSEGDLRGADLGWAHLNEADLRGARLSEADLRGAILSAADLQEADLRWANLHRADLNEADLHGADLREAHLNEANLSDANLRGAYLSAADLSGACLTRAFLNDAHLSEAGLTQADLSDANLRGAVVRRARLDNANLRSARLNSADLRGARLNEANLHGANLNQAHLSGVDLSSADLSGADLSGADLSEANLSGADLTRTICIAADFSRATLTGCRIYGVSSWDVQLDGATQQDLYISPDGQLEIQVDDFELALLLYLLLKSKNLLQIIAAITSRAVLILGHFTPERKAVLDALRDELRKHNYLPVLFDFQGPENKDIVQTVTLLARMARFIIADLTDAAMVRSELLLIVPALPSVPVQPLLQGTALEQPEIEHLRRFRTMLPTYNYEDLPGLLAELPDHVIAPTEAKVVELRKLREPEPDNV